MNVVKTIARWGNANALRIPTAMLEQLQLRESSKVEMSVEEGRLVITPVRPETNSLEALLEGSSPELFRVPEDDVWLNKKPVGEELL